MTDIPSPRPDPQQTPALTPQAQTVAFSRADQEEQAPEPQAQGAPTAAYTSGGPPTDGPPLTLPPPLIDHPRYRILGLLGCGGMGVVYKAQHRLMDRLVALKVINRQLVDRPGTVERFHREMKAAAQLTHPNIVTAYDAEDAGNLHFLVMEYVEGTNLDQLVREQGPLPVAQACDYARQAALGLEQAFAHGLVHRDIKPANLIRTPSGNVKILDFGLAHFASEQAPEDSLTGPGSALGTPDYMAPEQARDAHAADIRADLYSLGCTLYYLLAGHPPFPGGSASSKLAAHLERAPQPLAEVRPDIPRELAAIVDRLMAKDPERRYQTPAEVAAALAPFVHPDSPAPRRRPRRWLVVAVLPGVLVVAAALFGLAVSRLVTHWGQPQLPTTVEDQTQWYFLGGQAPLPPYLQENGQVLEEKNGLRLNGRHYLLTKAGDYLNKDFRFQLLFSLAATEDNLVFIGLGAADRRAPFNEPGLSAYLRIHPPDVDNGWVGLSNAPVSGGFALGRISSPGTHQVTIEKKGALVTFTLDVRPDGPSPEDMKKTIPDIRLFAPFLNDENTHLFFGGGGTYHRVRLVEAALPQPLPPLPKVELPNGLIATSGFNDAQGLNSDPATDSPFPLGVNNREGGWGEPGWLLPWEANPRATFQKEVVFEGDGALHLSGAQNVGPNYHRRLAEPQTGAFQVEQYVRIPRGGDVLAYVWNTNAFDSGPNWRANGEDFGVHDGDEQGDGLWISTGLGCTPDHWYKVTLRIDVPRRTWEFFVDDRKFVSPHPLRFRTRQTALQEINYLSGSNAGVYLDAIRISRLERNVR